jgi:hypothetical protein
MIAPKDGLILNLRDVFKLPDSAVDWLVLIYDSIQVFDDFADGDPVSKKDLDLTLWDMMVGQYRNQFFISNSMVLIPLVEVAILKWHGANSLEKNNKADSMSFVWRASYFDLVLMAVKICNGLEFATKNSHLVASLYGEDLVDYLEEVYNA